MLVPGTKFEKLARFRAACRFVQRTFGPSRVESPLVIVISQFAWCVGSGPHAGEKCVAFGVAPDT